MENELKIENNSFNYINPQLSNENNKISDNSKNECKGIGNNIIHPPIPGVDGYKVFIRQDGFPDFGNFISYDNNVEFDPNKYKRPEIYFGYIHDQYLVPQILGLKNINKKKEEEKKDEINKENKKNKDIIDKSKIKEIKNKKINKIKNLDDIMNSLNLKYIEPPKKEKIVEPPPEEENVEEEENPKDKNKKGKDANIKGKNIKEDPKNKPATKPVKK